MKPGMSSYSYEGKETHLCLVCMFCPVLTCTCIAFNIHNIVLSICMGMQTHNAYGEVPNAGAKRDEDSVANKGDLFLVNDTFIHKHRCTMSRTNMHQMSTALAILLAIHLLCR